ncbi:MAG: hypothetical protein V4820_18550 [Pseudomonadota bacterium]
MNKNVGVSVAVIAVLAAGGLYLLVKPAGDAPAPAMPASAPVASAGPATAPAASIDQAAPAGQVTFDPKNSTFTLDGQSVTIENGMSSIPSAPKSASSTTTRYFGDERRGDFNNDGQEDIAFIVTQDAGGSGLFYFIVAAIKGSDGYKTTNGFFIGDRIAPQSITIPRSSNELQVNFADRQPGEPMTAPPTAGRVLLLKVTPQGVLEGVMK